MNFEKILELIKELEKEKETIDIAIMKLKDIIPKESGLAIRPRVLTPNQAALFAPRSDSYINLTIDLLKKEGRPLYIKDIIQTIQSLRGGTVKRSSVEATIIQHIRKKKDHAKIKRVGVGMYALRTSD